MEANLQTSGCWRWHNQKTNQIKKSRGWPQDWEPLWIQTWLSRHPQAEQENTLLEVQNCSSADLLRKKISCSSTHCTPIPLNSHFTQELYQDMSIGCRITFLIKQLAQVWWKSVIWSQNFWVWAQFSGRGDFLWPGPSVMPWFLPVIPTPPQQPEGCAGVQTSSQPWEKLCFWAGLSWQFITEGKEEI